MFGAERFVCIWSEVDKHHIDEEYKEFRSRFGIPCLWGMAVLLVAVDLSLSALDCQSKMGRQQDAIIQPKSFSALAAAGC